MPSIWLVTDCSTHPSRHVLGLFNWDSTARTLSCEAGKAGLDPAKPYQAFDFWSGKSLPLFQGQFQFELPPSSCRVIAVRPVSGHPQLLSTSRHVTQGILDVAVESWDAAHRTLSGRSAVVALDPYELRIAGLQDGGQSWNAAGVELSRADISAGVSAKLSRDGEILRILLSSPVSRMVRWLVRF